MATTPIVVKSSSAVTAVGPGGSSAVITIAGVDDVACEVTLINDGADPINYFFNVDTSIALPVFAADAFTLKISESITHRVQGLTNLFMICDMGDTATIRYLVDSHPATNKNHF